MQTLDQCLKDLVKKGQVDKEEARSKAADPMNFQV
jgi:Tfp pilus assembly pilus retraction ATPase PilT